MRHSETWPEPTAAEIDQANLDVLVAAALATVGDWNGGNPVGDHIRALASALEPYHITKTGKVLTEREIDRYVDEAVAHLAETSAPPVNSIQRVVDHVTPVFEHLTQAARVGVQFTPEQRHHHSRVLDDLRAIRQWLAVDQTPGGGIARQYSAADIPIDLDTSPADPGPPWVWPMPHGENEMPRAE